MINNDGNLFNASNLIPGIVDVNEILLTVFA